MSNEVYANGEAVSCKGGAGNVAGAFPDVCNSPPPPPAGPVPVPYPNSSRSSDLKRGSKSVMVSGGPAALKNQSHFASAPIGDEAATRAFGGSLLSHTITGKTYFAAWSMDVKIEGKNVCRHLDITTSNHASYPGSTPPFPQMEKMTATAQARIKANLCPCCGKSECPAAFKDDEAPQSMEDFYGLNAATPEGADRMNLYKQMLGIKAQSCTCDGRVFPKAPCDVFRAPDVSRKKAIESHWSTPEVMRGFYAQYVDANPNAISQFRARNPTQAPPSRGPAFGQTNHLTPKSAGGCPDSPGNLQPHDTLCAACKKIDGLFTHWQNNNPNWRSEWNKVFRGLKIKRYRIADFTPGWW